MSNIRNWWNIDEAVLVVKLFKHFLYALSPSSVHVWIFDSFMLYTVVICWLVSPSNASWGMSKVILNWGEDWKTNNPVCFFINSFFSLIDLRLFYILFASDALSEFWGGRHIKDFHYYCINTRRIELKSFSFLFSSPWILTLNCRYSQDKS